MDLYNELQVRIKELNTSIKSLRNTGREYAEAYTQYRIKLAQKLVELKNDGMPVTIAYDVARGDKEIAKAKYNEIAKEAVYKANQEAINSIKLQIRVIESQLSREYGNVRNWRGGRLKTPHPFIYP